MDDNGASILWMLLPVDCIICCFLLLLLLLLLWEFVHVTVVGATFTAEVDNRTSISSSSMWGAVSILHAAHHVGVLWMAGGCLL